MVDWAVFETGLGGRLDATNIIIPQVSVITGIAIDHTDYLGPTLHSIAVEKLGIVKDGCPLVFTKNRDQSIMELAAKTCAEKNAQLHIVSTDDVSEIGDDQFGVKFTWHNKLYRSPLHGTHQVTNALCALNALQCVGINEYKTQKKGLENAFIPGRFQIIEHKGKTIVIDVGHNPDGASVVVSTLDKKFRGKSVCFVTGMMKDKDTSGILKQYCIIADHIILTKPLIARAAQPVELLNAVEIEYLKKCEICSTVSEAVRKALERDEEVVCITGSFYTVSEAFQYLGIDPYKYHNT
jgi:dihydrofolate synthase / folylpolyglutamate synthase